MEVAKHSQRACESRHGGTRNSDDTRNFTVAQPVAVTFKGAQHLQSARQCVGELRVLVVGVGRKVGFWHGLSESDLDSLFINCQYIHHSV